MRVIENKYNSEIEITCPHCGSRIAYKWDSLDRHETPQGESYIRCGACSEVIFVRNNRAEENKVNPNAQPVSCEKCGQTTNITADDLTEGEFGCHVWTCPCCKNVNATDSSVELTENNVVYPQHFFDFSNGLKTSDKDINKWVKECVSKIDKDNDFCYGGTGDTFVIAFKSEPNEVSVIVCNGYHETAVQIPEERW